MVGLGYGCHLWRWASINHPLLEISFQHFILFTNYIYAIHFSISFCSQLPFLCQSPQRTVFPSSPIISLIPHPALYFRDFNIRFRHFEKRILDSLLKKISVMISALTTLFLLVYMKFSAWCVLGMFYLKFKVLDNLGFTNFKSTV